MSNGFFDVPSRWPRCASPESKVSVRDKISSVRSNLSFKFKAETAILHLTHPKVEHGFGIQNPIMKRNQRTNALHIQDSKPRGGIHSMKQRQFGVSGIKYGCHHWILVEVSTYINKDNFVHVSLFFLSTATQCVDIRVPPNFTNLVFYRDDSSIEDPIFPGDETYSWPNPVLPVSK